MSGGFPLGFEIANAQGITSQIFGIGCTASGTANTKGAYSVAIASTAGDCVWIHLSTRLFDSSNGGTVAIDLAVGATGSEQVVVPNLVVCQPTASEFAFKRWAFPLHIPAGTNLSIRCQGNNTNADSPRLGISFWDGSFPEIEGCAGVDTIGFVAGSTQGTAVTSGAGVYGSYTQLVASTSRDYIGFFTSSDTQGGTSPNTSGALDIAVGAGGSEQNIATALNIGWTANTDATNVPFLPIPIPVGSRVSARAMFGGAITAGVTLYGVYQ